MVVSGTVIYASRHFEAEVVYAYAPHQWPMLQAHICTVVAVGGQCSVLLVFVVVRELFHPKEKICTWMSYRYRCIFVL